MSWLERMHHLRKKMKIAMGLSRAKAAMQQWTFDIVYVFEESLLSKD